MAEKITRREMLKLSGFAIAGAAIGASGLGGVMKMLEDEAPKASTHAVAFYGKHQPGITTPHQSNVYFASLNFVGQSKAQLQQLFQDWTRYSERMMQGQSVEDEDATKHVPPVDTGEAFNLDAANLTLTFGVGPSLFEHASLGLKNKKPAELMDLPHFPKDQLQKQWTGGDLCIQACADDPQVAFHAVRNLLRVGSGVVQLHWSQAGFMSMPADGGTPRNLFSFKDGTVNPKTTSEFDEHVWVSNHEQSWLNNGTYLIVRRIQMHLETWDRTSLHQQEMTFGRYRHNGALFGQADEFAETDVFAKDVEGESVVPENSHVYLSRLAKQTIYRRPFSYASGTVTETGAYDSGLLFISFQKHPKQFIDIQNSLGRMDKLNEYITHRGSALFACLPGVKKGSYLGEALFTSL
ncbi:iron uptake transporter deferrochelatase/peroxidase subunit [Lysinibacillus sp. KU-BSD001]|uniref:iron uptake transporter deferrochelatase/peroxidase subunit n=1 Tax=Lysinibacillus sp. KU-BSD001 TaxID=3141328 RepID=UPI0036E6A868